MTVGLSKAARPPRVARTPFASLAVGLAAVACGLALPILIFASAAQQRLYDSIARIQNERNAVRWIAEADDLAERLAALHVSIRRTPRRETRVRISDADRITVERSLDALERAARDTARALPVAPRAAARLRIAWTAALDRPSGETFAGVVDGTHRSIGAIADGSSLSYEADPVVADFSGALIDGYYSSVVPLAAAGDTLRVDLLRGRLDLDDRIVIAGLLARARDAGVSLQAGLDDAFARVPRLAAIARPVARAGTRAAHDYETTVRTIVRRVSQPPATAARLDAASARFARLGRPFFAVASAQALAALDVRRERRLAENRTLQIATLVAIAFVFLMTTCAGWLIERRDRYDLDRESERADALAAELGRRKAEHDRMMTEAQFDAVFDRSQVGIALLDASGATVECNPALREILGSATPSIVAPADERFADLLAGGRATYQYESELVRRDGATRFAQITVSSIDVPRSATIVALAMIQDFTERRAIDERLRFEAAHDHLTSLPNRGAFLAALDGALREKHDLARAGVLFVDLDKFKLINDTLGHPAGDRAIAIAGQRLVGATRPGDVVARLHGDEFAVLLVGLDERCSARTVADRIATSFLAPVSLDGTTIVLTASVGIVAGLDGYASAEDAMRDADVAMYHAKKLGRSRAAVFDGRMHERIGNHMRMMTDVRFALDRREFSLVYQPIVNLHSGGIVGIEALMRWTHPTLGEMEPSDFIPVAEETSVIRGIGRFALRETCAALARLDAAGAPRLGASVNLSVAHLAFPEVVADVRDALATFGVAADRLTIEITESGLLESGANVVALLGDLSRLGVRLCIDDFGTGYSSLRYLHEYPIDVLKIDRSFVSGERGGLANESIVQMLLTLARSLDISAIAEGVETEAQRTALLEAGCRTGQGYLYSAGLEESRLLAWIAARASDHAAEELAFTSDRTSA